MPVKCLDGILTFFYIKYTGFVMTFLGRLENEIIYNKRNSQISRNYY